MFKGAFVTALQLLKSLHGNIRLQRDRGQCTGGRCRKL